MGALGSDRRIDWSEGLWTTAPVEARPDGDDLLVTAAEGSDAWRTTAYGFVHDTEHALLAPFVRDSAVEVTFRADLTEQFDQAGVFLRAADDHWIKAGLEFSDGVLQLGAVVTAPVSDWSVAPVPTWLGRLVTIRASWAGDAVTIRARVDDEPFRLVRVAPFGGRGAAVAPSAPDAPPASDAAPAAGASDVPSAPLAPSAPDAPSGSGAAPAPDALSAAAESAPDAKSSTQAGATAPGATSTPQTGTTAPYAVAAPHAGVDAGPFACAPTRAGLTVRFLSWHVTAPDSALH